MAAMNAALGHLLATNWSAPCSTSFFCFGCESPLCGHCCERHAHRAVHHPHAAGHPLLVETISRGRLAIDVDSFKGSGYCIDGIRRVKWQGRRFILILPDDADDLRSHTHCPCGNRINTNCAYCCLECRTVNELGGARRHVAQQLVALAEGGLFGPPVHPKNRFCMICRRAFSNDSCPNHPAHGHPLHPLYPAAGPEDIKTIHHVDGWAVIPDGQLPAPFVQDVQVVQGPDGIAAYPIHPREHPLPPVDLQLQQAHDCARQGCLESFVGNQPFCSLRCSHHHP